MQVELKNIAGETVGDVELRDDIFAVEPNLARIRPSRAVRWCAPRLNGTGKRGLVGPGTEAAMPLSLWVVV
jgi:ribosomal protein L4